MSQWRQQQPEFKNYGGVGGADWQIDGQWDGEQFALLSISKLSPYYEPKGETEINLDLMRLIDKDLLATPFLWRASDYMVSEQ
ncbi:hypothetical protein [Sulfitobacter guttiformis]|uniref:hypothetical protein n=1 Tax=Sulfitobacter guttiformis TaxID=74349 RepID=UPI000469528B|nr:hypothetical protein [Sulfitobacter guttiformis]KIN71250.1 transposase [Sulfitobacter guttiformis KCTC 32187]